MRCQLIHSLVNVNPVYLLFSETKWNMRWAVTVSVLIIILIALQPSAVSSIQ